MEATLAASYRERPPRAPPSGLMPRQVQVSSATASLPYGFLAVRRRRSTPRQEVVAVMTGVVGPPRQPGIHVVLADPVRRADAQLVPVPRHDRLGAVVAGVLGARGAYLNPDDPPGAG